MIEIVDASWSFVVIVIENLFAMALDQWWNSKASSSRIKFAKYSNIISQKFV